MTIITITNENTIGSNGYVAGRRYVGLLPVGNYKIHNPIGGRATRNQCRETMLIPAEQSTNTGYEGSFYTVKSFKLDKLINKS